MANATENGSDPPYMFTAIGNPNVDIIIKVNDTYLFDKYNLSLDGHRPADAKLLDSVKDDIVKRKYEVIYTPGGCAQNTTRVLQWLINSPYKCVMIGAIGTDNEALYLEDEVSRLGVKTVYSKLRNFRTASVIVITYKNNRSSLYGLSMGAASMYHLPMLLENNEALESIKNSKIVHQEAFFTVHSPDVGLQISRICAENDIITSFNLCGEYVFKREKNAVLPHIHTCDIIIGNIVEFFVLCDELKIPHDDVNQALLDLHQIMLDSVKTRKNYAVECMKNYVKILIITNDDKPVHCVTKSDGLIHHTIPAVDERIIKDTTGAGDAFLGGFLYGILHDSPIRNCLQLGCKMAAEIIQSQGCILPNNKDPATFINQL